MSLRFPLILSLTLLATLAGAGELPVEPATPTSPVVVSTTPLASPTVISVLNLVAAGSPSTSAAIATLAAAEPGTPAAFSAVQTLSVTLATEINAGNIAIPSLPPAALAQALAILTGLEVDLAAAGYDASGIAALRAALTGQSSAPEGQP